MTLPVIVVGAGGHAIVVADALLASGTTILGFTDTDVRTHGRELIGIPVLGADDVLGRYTPDALCLANALGGAGKISSLDIRAKVQRRLQSEGWRFATVLHPRALISPFATIAESAQCLANCIVQPRAIVKEGCIINSGAIVEHDTCIGDYVHVACGATLCGNVTIGAYSHIGAGATVREGTTLGVHTIVGAGAVVVKSFPADATLCGVPARNWRG